MGGAWHHCRPLQEPREEPAIATAPEASDRPLRALFFMLLAQFFFSSNIFLLRLTEQLESSHAASSFQLTPWEPMLYRSVALSLWCLYRLRLTPGEPVNAQENFWLWARGVVGVLSLTTYYYGVLHIPLGMASLFSNSSPLYVTLLAILISGELVNRLRLVSVVFGFAGVALVAWGALQGVHSLTALDVGIAALSGPLAALAYFSIRQLKRIRNEQIMLSLGLSGTLLAALVLWVTGWHLPASGLAHGVLMLSVLPAILAQNCLTVAFRSAPASQVSPLQYTGPVFSTIYGAMFLEESMPNLAFFGVVVVLIFGLVIPYSEAIWLRKKT